jgi:ATP-dependent RNA helicase DOB1
MLEDLNAMRRVLERLGFVDRDGIVIDKGRVASVITAGDELVMTEMLYDGVVKDLTPQQIAALMCVFACDEGGKEEPEIPEDLMDSWMRTKGIIERIVNVSRECGIQLRLDEYMANFDATYMMLCYNWAGGADFSELMEENPRFFEGSVIRTVKRTEEILRQLSRAAKEMGESNLELTILEAITVIKRDIIFAASLYL